MRAWIATLLCAASLLPVSVGADCSLTSVGIPPLSDTAAGSYLGHPGGLYPGGSSTRPAAHESAGVAIASGVVPLDATGAPAPTSGEIVMISIGMSNPRTEFARFVSDVAADASLHPRLRVVNGAQDARTADHWANPSANAWSVLASNLTSAGHTAAQVQIAWIKLALPFPNTLGAFPAHAEALRDDLIDVVTNLKSHYPNVKLAYLSSRTRAYVDDAASLNPEPFAYESGFAVRWLIEAQLSGDPLLNFDPGQGPVLAPYLSWGPYLWADGTTPRSDGYAWPCSMVTSADFTHPSSDGNESVARQLMAFFKTDATTVPWFLGQSAVGQPPSCSFSVAASPGTAPSIVTISDTSSDPDGTLVEHARSYADGTFSFDVDPIKLFEAPGNYTIGLTVTDDSANLAHCTQVVSVPEPGVTLSLIAGAAAVAGFERRRRARAPR